MAAGHGARREETLARPPEPAVGDPPGELARLPSEADLLQAIEGLYSQLAQTTDLLQAIRAREVDAVLYAGATDPQVFMLQSADHVYRIIIEQMREGAALVSEGGTILYANGALSRLLGVPTGALVGEPLAEFVNTSSRDALGAMKWGGRPPRGGNGPRDLTLVRPDGGTVPVLASSTDLPLEGARIRSFVMTDITEKKRIEEYLLQLNDRLEFRVAERTAELNRMVEELQRSNDDLQRFAYVASHDLQEPLRSIVSFSQLLERRCRPELGPEALEYLDFIVEGGNRMQTLITDLLTFSRITSRGSPLVETDAGEVLGEALHDLTGAIEEAGAMVTAGPMPWVRADAAQLAQVFVNLVGNALKYRRLDVAPEVRIEAERVGKSWRFAVADNGIGIEEQYYDRIFVLFQRLHTKEAYTGTGIGLAVVKKIVERHGGRAWVESTPGTGSTFFFTLPAA